MIIVTLYKIQIPCPTAKDILPALMVIILFATLFKKVAKIIVQSVYIILLTSVS